MCLNLSFYNYCSRYNDKTSYITVDVYAYPYEIMTILFEKLMKEIEKDVMNAEKDINMMIKHNIDEQKNKISGTRYSDKYFSNDDTIYKHELWKNVSLNFSDVNSWKIKRYRTSNTNFKDDFDLTKPFEENDICDYTMLYVTHVNHCYIKHELMEYNKFYKKYINFLLLKY